MIIKKVKARRIKNSRNEDTIEIEVKSDIGKAKASSPAGKSKGAYEAKYYNSKLLDVIKQVNSNKKIIGLKINKFNDLEKIEEIFNYGSNPRVALEYAILKNFKNPYKEFSSGYRHLPIPLGNSIGGGLHTKEKLKPDFQEFLIYVENCKSFSKRVKINKIVYENIKKELKTLLGNKFKGKRNDEGAWVVPLSNIEVLDFLYGTIKLLSVKLGVSLRIGIDIASSSFYGHGDYHYKNYSSKKRQVKLNKQEQIDFMLHLVKRYKIGYLEDPLEQNDFTGFNYLRSKVKDCLIVGDDLTVTNYERVKKAIKEKCVSGIIIKPNQIGSLIEVKNVVNLCKLNKIKTIFSHRSGETNEDFLSDLCFILGGDYIKTGIYGKERISKLDRLNKIENSI